MKYFLDTEFIERKDSKKIDLISLGIVDEDGRGCFYVVNKDCDFSKASDWVLTNVLKPIGIDRNGYNKSLHTTVPYHTDCALADYNSIPYMLEDYFKKDSSNIEFWGYYCSSDWIIFYQLFGTLLDLPEYLPQHCNDIKTYCDLLEQYYGEKIELPKMKSSKAHVAINDARHIKDCYYHLSNTYPLIGHGLKKII